MRKQQYSVEELTVTTVINNGYKMIAAGVSAAETDADASVAVTVSGVLATDVAFASLVSATTAQAITKVACTTDTVTVSLGGNGGANTQVFYQVYRAA